MATPLSFYGQINFTELKEALKSGHIKAQRIQTKKGEQIVFGVNVWVHSEADQFNNNAAIQMELHKEAFENKVQNTFYIGNLRYKIPTSTEASAEDIGNAVGNNEDDDLPF